MVALASTGRPLHYRSLREHIDALRALNELREIDQEVDRADEKAAMFTTKSVFDCLPYEDWSADARPIPARFDRVYPADLQAGVLRDWKAGYGLP
jgi:hypothetical protein